MTAWTDFVKKFYNEKKAMNPLYKFKDALRDGANEYKKGVKDVLGAATEKPKRGKTGKRGKNSSTRKKR
jgi:hypothetical protein